MNINAFCVSTKYKYKTKSNKIDKNGQKKNYLKCCACNRNVCVVK